MRLINTSTFELHEFFDKQIPFYAILSHRWEDDEITFQDLQSGKGPEMAGWSKIIGCCSQATKNGWKYAWIDSCCIDKTSSAELSEAINSMFEWYRRAEVCYAYLSDVSMRNSDRNANEVAFRHSKWFTRGWTLQELLAPQWVEFYDRGWKEIGTKSSLADLITSITGIAHLFNFEEACIAQKMSWASRRETTRLEDQAYCLMGLFDVHMPPLYGEGKKAFRRLQLEILSRTNDESIFAWYDSSGNESGLLASSPERFRKSGNIKIRVFDVERPPHVMTNQGLRLELFLTPTLEDNQSKSLVFPMLSPISSTVYLAPLNCVMVTLTEYALHDALHVALPLWERVNADITRYSRSWFRRGQLQVFDGTWSNGLKRSVIYTITDIPKPIYGRPGTVLIRTPSTPDFPFSVVEKYVSGGGALWSQDCAEGYMLKSFYSDNTIALLKFEDTKYKSFVLILGTSDFVFWVDLKVFTGNLQLEGLLGDFVRSKESRGGGERIIRELGEGRLLTVSSKKQFHGGSYCYVVDMTFERGRRLRTLTQK